jgi:hypothetical protein
MGFSLTATNSKYSFSGGYGSFAALRANIAKAWDKEFGEHYDTLRACFRESDYDAFNKETERILSQERFQEGGGKADSDIVEFLFASDCAGSISHKTCKKIYDIIKGIDFHGEIFTYAMHSDGKDYERLKDFLLDCHKRRVRARWS